MSAINELPVAIECTNGRMLFLSVARDATVAALEDQVRTALSTKKLSLIIDGCTPASSTMLCDVHENCKRADGCLYMAVRAERAMGGHITPCFAWDGPYDPVD